MTGKENDNLTPEVFQFASTKQEVRSLLVENVPWFVAKDVCDILGVINHKHAVKSLDDDEVVKSYLTDTLGRNQLNLFVNESGLYALIMRSNKPEAKLFRKWVTSEVLPAIRKKGYYSVTHKSKNNFIDARNVPYHTVELNGTDVRCLQLNDVAWYSLNDVNKAMESSTEATQAAKKLNAISTNAQKIFIFGNTNPAWFVTALGVHLLLSGSRKLRAPQSLQLALSFKGIGGAQ